MNAAQYLTYKAPKCNEDRYDCRICVVIPAVSLPGSELLLHTNRQVVATANSIGLSK